ncbi:MAG: alpha-aminoadipate/glutamate carrier protein LysW/ArgW [Candidatus Bathyarchaeia archaeon]
MPDYKCQDCSADVQVPSDALDGEIVVCPDCGLELQVKKKPSGEIELTEVTKEKEDWGE